jgi:tetratricopeptide (TPR) repeat protein
VSVKHGPSPAINKYYHDYLLSEESASFILRVSQRYTVGTLMRLAGSGGRIERRAAVLALGFLGDFDACVVLGRALKDGDRGVRMLAENGMRSVWCRAGNEEQRHKLRLVMRLISCGQFSDAEAHAEGLLADAPAYAEAWHQRAVARYHLGAYADAIGDAREALELNPYHFAAAAAIGQCYLELDAPRAALETFRRALQLNPGLELVRAKISSLQRAMEGR